MRVIGFDPGINVTGFGILDYTKRNAKAHGYGVIKPPKNKSLAERLLYLHDETMKLLKKFKPNVVAVEDTFYHKNFKSALMLGQARGVIILAAARNEITCAEFAPKKSKAIGGRQWQCHKRTSPVYGSEYIEIKRCSNTFGLFRCSGSRIVFY